MKILNAEANLSFSRIKTLSLYYLYTMRRNPFQSFLSIFWPVFDLIIWGFTIIYLQGIKIAAFNLLAFILGAAIAWNLLLRAQQLVSQQFMQDVYSRNFNNIFITPIKLWEMLTALILSTLVKLLLMLCLLAVVVYLLFAFNLLKINLWFLFFFANLIIFGWTLGIISIAFVLRFSYRFEFLTWALAFLFFPLSCVFYSRNSLPTILKFLSYFVPPSYIFEAMRDIVLKENFLAVNLYLTSFLNFLYILAAWIFFLVMLKWARQEGSLTRI